MEARPVSALESQVERHLVSRVRALGGTTIKMAPAGQVGVPDRLVLLPGMEPIMVELKTATGRLSPAQEVFHDKVRHLGFTVYVVKGKVGVNTLLEGLHVNDRIAKASGRLSAARRWKGSENAPDEAEALSELAEARLERAIGQSLPDLTDEARERMARLLDGGDVL